MAGRQIRRGTEAERIALGGLAAGELGFSTDKRYVHIGSSVGDIRIHGDYITPEQFGCVGDGATFGADNTAAFQACIDAAWTNQKPIFLSGHTYLLGNIVVPVDTHGTITIIGREFGSIYSTATSAKLKFYLVDGSDFIDFASPGAGSLVCVNFENLIIEGPDTGGTTDSGNGVHMDDIRITFTPSWRNVRVSFFKGAGKAGIWGKDCEYSGFDNIDVCHNCWGAQFLQDCNSSVFTNFRSQNNVNGILIEKCVGQTWNTVLIQSNEEDGLYIHGLMGGVFNAPYFENNNSSITAGKHALQIIADGAGFQTYSVSFIGSRWNTARDTVNLSGNAASYVTDVKFDGFFSGAADPQITIANTFVFATYYRGIGLDGAAIANAGGALCRIENADVLTADFDFPSFLSNKRWTYGIAVPAAGTWQAGDVCWHIDAASGEPMGWQCTVAGTPGTWNAMANLG